MRRFAWLLLSLLVAFPQAAWSQGITDLEIRRDEISGRILLGNGINGNFILSFEETLGLTANALNISAELVNPRDPQLLARLPENVFIPTQFPVLLRIDPNQNSNFSFRGRYSLEIRTPRLEFSSHTPLRLFRAPSEGTFSDISETMGFGSYRVRALGGAFSEFIIVSDLRNLGEVIDDKLNRLLSTLEDNADDLPTEILQEIVTRLETIEQNFQNERLGLALDQLDDLLLFIIRGSREDSIPNITDPSEGTVGLGAALRSQSASLRFSIDRLRQQAFIGQAGVTRRFELDDGIRLTVQLSFDDIFDVDLETLPMTAELIDIKNANFQARLPDGVRVPEAFPVLLRINPDADIDQAFCGNWSLEIQTDSLEFRGGTPLRLFKAPDGGAFEDITFTVGLGSYRVRALGGAFSEFVIAEDQRPVEEIVVTKLDRLGKTLDANRDQLPPALLQELVDQLVAFGQQLERGELEAALQNLENFQDLVEANEGTTIPGIWRSTGDRINVAGLLISQAESLKFSLEIQQTPIFDDPGDVNRDGEINFSDILALLQRLNKSP